MILANFEQAIDDVILRRGKDYFEQGMVVSLETKDGKTYNAKVDGSQTYRVEITVDTDKVINSNCTCPYDLGEYCKHEAAVLYAIKNMDGEKSTPIIENKLKNVLTSLKKEELIRIILDITDDFPDIEKRLLFQFAGNDDEVSESKKLIREYIIQAKRNGFIAWRDVDNALQGAELTLQKAKKKIEFGNIESAVLLALEVLPPVVKMLQFCDDSNGSVGYVLNRAVSSVDQAADRHEQLNDKEQKKIFDAILKEAVKAHYDDWSDLRFGLLKACTYFSQKKEFRNKLEKQLEILEKKAGNSRSAQYEMKEIKLLQLEIIERCDGEAEAEKFLSEYLHISEFREKAIKRLSEKEDFKKVISLCKAGEESDNSYPGLVNKWKEYRYLAYEELGDKENQRMLAHELMFKNHFSYYLKLKNLYSAEEFPEVLEKIIHIFEKERYYSSVYLSILKEENLTTQILAFCRIHKSLITELYSYLLETNLEEANELYKNFIEQSAEQATDRRGYKSVCKLIKTYKKAFGTIHAHKLIGELRLKYQKRPAFLDELGKIR